MMETAQEIRDNSLAHYVPTTDLERAIAEAEAGRQHHSRGTLTVVLRNIYMDLAFFVYPEDDLHAMIDEFQECWGGLISVAERHNLGCTRQLIEEAKNLADAIRHADERELAARLVS